MESKTLFNFYLDDEIKQKATDKLKRITNEKPKGQVASLIRVLLKQFIATPDEKVNPILLEAIDAEYEYSSKRNKRSSL